MIDEKQVVDLHKKWNDVRTLRGSSPVEMARWMLNELIGWDKIVENKKSNGKTRRSKY